MSSGSLRTHRATSEKSRRRRHILLKEAFIIAVILVMSACFTAEAYIIETSKPDPDIERYLNNLEHVLISVRWDDREVSYNYAPYDGIKRKLEDYKHRLGLEEFKKFVYPTGDIHSNNIDAKIVKSLEKRIDPDFRQKVKIYSAKNEAIEIQSVDPNKTMIIEFTIGQQRSIVLGRDAKLGAIGANLNPPPIEINKIHIPISPEPFLVFLDDSDNTQISRSIH